MEMNIYADTSINRDTMGALAQKMGRRSERADTLTQPESDQLRLSESMSDTAAFALLDNTRQNIFKLPGQALNAHSGLSMERVNSLLAFDF